MVTKEHILDEIRRVAEAHDGKTPGRERFASETGIQQSDWIGRYWIRWGDAVAEAGFEPNRLVTAVPEGEMLERLTRLVRELGHLPLEVEIRMKARIDPTFPSHTTWGRWGGKAARDAKLLAYCRQKGYDDVVVLYGDLASDAGQQSIATVSKPDPTWVAGVVYLFKSGRFYKIGKTNSVGRRQYELTIQLPEQLRLVHSITTDDPDGIERYWHQRFRDKRQNGEWFALAPEDIRAFQRRKFM